MRSSDNVCARATTGAAREGCFFTNTPNFNARATMSASGRQHLRPGDDVRVRPCDDGCCAGGVFFHQHPKLQRSCDDVYVRATTLAHGRRRPRSRNDIWILFGIFFRFCNPNKTFPLSLFENYSNSVEDGNPKLFLLVGVFLSALNRDLAFLSRHLSI